MSVRMNPGAIALQVTFRPASSRATDFVNPISPAFDAAWLEALAVNSSYIQDDWVRWGNANQVRATNLRGHELRAVYTFRPGMNLFARLFFVDAINLLQPGDTALEDGKRFRVEYNISF